ncbi:MAG TPA: hypothetical protein VF945_00265 [Polyangia bacterium]
MRIVVVLLGLLLSMGCSHRSGTGGGGGASGVDMGDSGGSVGGVNVPFAPSALNVSGQLLELDTQKPLAGSITMATAALVPTPDVTISGSTFALANVPPYATFFLIAGSPPDHLLTYNTPTTVTNADLTGVNAYVVASAYVAKLRSAFGVTAQAGTATVFVQALDSAGKPQAGIPATSVLLGASGVKGPFFVDSTMQPTANATSTSASGWLVYFDVPAGTLKLAGGTGYTVQAADTPTVGDAVSLIAATVQKGTSPTPPPSNVSFQTSVMPIFINRGCYNCHSGNGDGRRLGGLVLDNAAQRVWTALVQTISPNFGVTRVNLTDPPKSLVLTMPSYENPPDAHPTVVFTSSSDPDYVKILTWIKEGAKFN